MRNIGYAQQVFIAGKEDCSLSFETAGNEHVILRITADTDSLARRHHCCAGNKGGNTRNKGFVLLRVYLPGGFEDKRYGSVFGEDLRRNTNAIVGKSFFNGFFRDSSKGKGGDQDAGIDDDVMLPLRGFFS